MLRSFSNSLYVATSSSPYASLVGLCASKPVRLTALSFFFVIVFLSLFRNWIPALPPAAEGLFAPSSPHKPDSSSAASALDDGIDWSRLAYAQYVTNSLYLCNSVMFFAKLQELGSRADRVMMYPFNMLPDPNATTAGDDDGRLLIKAREEFAVKLAPITIKHKSNKDPTWADSFTKLLAFNQTQYDRVLSMDSDSTLLQNMDELFLLPPAPVAMPRAYWLPPKDHILSSQIMLIQPSEKEFRRVQHKIDTAGGQDYDMEIMNQLYGNSALIIPHRPYNLITGEFREEDHAPYLGDPDEAWDPVAVFNEAKFLHFSDFPVPKPWLQISEEVKKTHEPPCEVHKDGAENCAARDLWNGFYKDFRRRKRRVCGHGQGRKESKSRIQA